jgi:hypothetical protein
MARLMAHYMSETGERPYLSVVVASRNDDHGGDILKRMRLFVGGLLEQTRRYRFPIELVFVQWNPPENRPHLHEVLPKPSGDDCLTLRYITVPASIHSRYRRAPDIPLFQMIAKNVGIRRAQGAFILCTNVDLLFSDALFQLMTDKTFRGDTYYRANRCDVPDGIDPQWDLDQQLAWCEQNIIRRWGRDSRYKNINLELVGLQNKGDIKKWLFDKMALGTTLFWSREKRLYHQLDLFACGDFTLMSREAWTAIQGYVELDLYSMHIDSLGLIAATSLGYRQHVFPPEACTYHIDHPYSEATVSVSPLTKLRFLGDRPALPYDLVLEVAMHSLGRREPFNLNPANWGHADAELEESVFTATLSGAARVAGLGVSSGA